MIDAGHLTIGPLRLNVRGADGVSVRYTDPAYAGFWSGVPASADAANQPLVEMPVTLSRETRAIPPGEPLYRGGKNWAAWDDGDDLVICSGFTGQPAARFHCRLARNLARAHVAMDPTREGVDPQGYDSPLRYPIDQILSWGLLARCGGLILHGAVAVKDGMGWVFTGRSGAGKSTISGLCHAAGWRILNDDRVILYKRNGSYRVAGTPWHGSGRFAEAADVPLAGIFFLHKSVTNRIDALDAGTARISILDVAAVPWFEETWSQDALDAADRLTSENPFFRFHFSKSPAAVDALVRHAVDHLAGVPA